jgi:Autographiviridae RNA polymerase
MTQQEFEKEMLDEGRTRYLEAVRKARNSGREADAPYGRRLLNEVIEPLALALRANNDRKRRRGKPSVADRCFQIFSTKKKGAAQDGPEVLAFIVSKLVIEQMSKPQRLAAVAVAIGRAIEQEAREANRIRLEKQLGSVDLAAATTWKPWTPQVHLQTGAQYLEFFMQITGLVERTLERNSKNRSEWRVHLSDAGAQWIANFHEMHEFLTPKWLPTIEPPMPWNERGERGGYHTISRPLVKPSPKAEPLICSERNEEVPTVARMAQAVNLVQQTAWVINRRVLQVMQRLVEEGVKVGDIPAPPKVKKGPPSKKEREQRANYLKAVLTLKAAERCESFPKIYFPHQTDWRGRFYAMPLYLSPQGPDYARALLTFANGQPIVNQAAANWLAIHGANCFGNDKVTFDHRLWWTFWAEKDILKCASDPVENRWWAEAADPWQFLAFCFEWAGYQREGFGFVSSLPIALDGTCNGLQHYAAMLRDEKSASSVNLIPPVSEDVLSSSPFESFDPDSDDELPPLAVAQPQDIYQHVADRVAARIQEDDYCAWFASYRVKKAAWIRRKKPNDRPRAQLALDRASGSAPSDSQRLQDLAIGEQINRKMLKSPVMTVVYGATDYGRQKTLRAFLTDGRESKTLEPIWPNVPRPVVTYLREVVTSEIHKAVPAALLAMRWLREVAMLVTNEDAAISWVTPCGFQIAQKYPNLETRRVETRLHGSTLKARSGLTLKLTIRTGEVRQDEPTDKRQQVRALPPNFIHSMDACALAETVLLAASPGGITSFAMIHDSYGTTAAQTEDLAKALRTSFVSMYRDHAPLTELRERIATLHPNLAKDLPPVPSIGTLNLEDVLAAPYFFN